jgi:iron complex outermembrane receptor protein
MKRYLHVSVWITVMLVSAARPEQAVGQSTGIITGKVTLQATGDPLRRAHVLVSQLGRGAETAEDGSYQITDVPPGTYEIMAHMHPLADLRRTVEVAAGSVVTVDFALVIAPVHEEITITAAGREQLPLETFQSVTSLELIDLAPRAASSLGEVLEGEAGVAKRSYGPGTSRPIVRGFDGDRVLILQDGMPSGTLSSQSGDHGEPIDVGTVERVEIVRGPATLLYGTNAIGGVVNVITEHHQEHEHAHEGVRGFLTGAGGTNNGQAGGSGGLEVGTGKWLLLASGGGTRSGDYSTPLGKVANSETELKNTAASLGRFSGRGFFRFGYGIQDGAYGIPWHTGDTEGQEEGPVDLQWRRHNARVTGGILNLSPLVEKLGLNLDFSDWHHRELAGGVAGTEFFNRQYAYRAVFNQRPRRGVLGSFGANGLYRSYRVRGEEQITPAVTQTGFAVFGLEEIPLQRARVQLGGRLETNRYNPEGRPSRTFTGFSGSAGINAPLWKDGALITSYSYSYRAPAIEELYNHGPHEGNLAFEIGDPNLGRERANGLEIGLRHRASRLHAEANFFYYRIGDYVYLAPTAEREEGLTVANYRQADTRYLGGEALLHAGLRSNLWVKLAMDAVEASLRQTGTPLPRIPPVRGRIGVEARFRDWSFQPELVLVSDQNSLYVNETRTPGYAALNLVSDYTITRKRALHIFSVNVSNAGDRLYRNHCSLIKQIAPEMGRSVRVAYTVRFF